MFKKRWDRERAQGRSTLGFFICLAALVILFWNEGRAVKTARNLSLGQGSVTSIPAKGIDPTNDGKLVHLTGRLYSPVKKTPDRELGLSFKDVVIVDRQVDMYQWKGSSRGKGDNASYTYKKTWKNKRIDSTNYSEDYKNPLFLVENKSIIADVVKVNDFELDPVFLKKIKAKERLILGETHGEELLAAVKDKAMIHEGGLYIAHHGPPDPQRPRVGDTRVRYYGTGPITVSVIAGQTEGRLVPFEMDGGGSLAMLKKGKQPADKMFTRASQQNKVYTWMLRGFGFAMIFVAMRFMLFGLSKRLESTPLAKLTGVGMNILSALLAAILSAGVISMAWIFHRPLFVLAFLALLVAGFFVVRKKISSK